MCRRSHTLTAQGALVLLALVVGPGCRRHEALATSGSAPVPATQAAAPVVLPRGSKPTTNPSTWPTTALANRSFESKDAHIRIQYPQGWVTRPSDDYVLLAGPPGPIEEVPNISLDIPSLPPHLPGMITLGRVTKGYL